MNIKTVLGWCPLLILVIVLFWSYVTVTDRLYWKPPASTSDYALNMTLLVFFFWMTLWSLFAVVCIVPKRVKTPFKLSDETLQLLLEAQTEEEFNQMIIQYCLLNKIRLWTRTETGCIRYCDKCKAIKPDRCYHCYICRTCVLRKDHHSRVFNKCISFTNYKCYLCFLIWATCYFMYITLTRMDPVLSVILMSEIGILDASDFSFISVYVVSFLISMYFIVMVLMNLLNAIKNVSGVEAWVAPTFLYNQSLSFSVSIGFNCRETFGSNPFLWLLPVPNSPGNGYDYNTSYSGRCNE